MSNQTERLKHKLKIKVGLPPGTPTDAQLKSIISEVNRIKETRKPTEADWVRITIANVPNAGSYAYASEDMSDLNTLLDEINKSSITR